MPSTFLGRRLRGQGISPLRAPRYVEEQGNHAIGGLGCCIVPPEQEPISTDKKIDVLVQLLHEKKRWLFGTDEMRRTLEGLPGEVYDRHRSYER